MHDLSATIRRNTLLLAAVGATAIVVSPVAWILWRTEAPRAAPENR